WYSNSVSHVGSSVPGSFTAFVRRSAAARGGVEWTPVFRDIRGLPVVEDLTYITCSKSSEFWRFWSVELFRVVPETYLCFAAGCNARIFVRL
ncbi:unnamed protein product, partial [Scytosiphon promiscuus]